MDSTERTRLVWERPAAYPAPPLPPLPDPDDLAPFSEIGIRVDGVSRPILRAASAISGFSSFRHELPGRLEDLLHRTELRGGILFAPVLSATLALRDDPRGLSATERAATLVLAARSLWRDVQAGTLPPDRHGEQVLEMAQYANLFSTSLIVEKGRARLFKSARAGRIHVAAGGRLFALDLPDLTDPSAGDPPVAVLAEALEKIARSATERPLPPDEVPPGLITAAPHGLQIRLLDRLARIPVNREALDSLRHGFLVLCLDLDRFPTDAAEIAALTHGGVPDSHPENRWSAASLQLVVFGNGKAGAVASFSAYLDGNVMMRAGAELQKRAAGLPFDQDSEGASPLPPATELRWEIPAAEGRRVREALRPFRDDQPSTFEIAGYGRSFFEERGVAATPAFVLALQLAADRLAGRPVEILQIVTQSAWRCADPAAAVVTTPEVRRWVERIGQPETDGLREAVESQTRAVRQARSRLPFEMILGLFLRTRTGLGRQRALLTVLPAGLLLRLLGRAPADRDVLISHPAIHPEVSLLGRPGVRLPYLRCFGLHYQMLADRTVLTVMPATTWKVPNADLAAALGEELERVGRMVEAASG